MRILIYFSYSITDTSFSLKVNRAKNVIIESSLTVFLEKTRFIFVVSCPVTNQIIVGFFV